MADLLNLLQDAIATPPENVHTRRKLYDACRTLMLSIEPDHDAQQRILNSNQILPFAQTAVDLDLFQTISSGPEQGYLPTELSSTIPQQVDPMLLHRILRSLATHGLVIEDLTTGRFKACHQTHLFARENTAAGVHFKYLGHGPVFQHLSAFLRETGYKNPTNDSYTAVHKAYGMSAYDYVYSHPDLARTFMLYMRAQRADQVSWIADESFFPRRLFVLPEEDMDGMMFVDVGGGLGHQCLALRQHHPELKGRILLQERSTVVAQLDSENLKLKRIEWMDHDATLTQPIRNARIYYVRNVLHDFQDPTCHAMLSQLREATLEREDSVVLIDEIVMPDKGATWKQVNYDITMMAVANAMERTMEQWEALIGSAGLRIEEVIRYDEEKADSLIVCRPIR